MRRYLHNDLDPITPSQRALLSNGTAAHGLHGKNWFYELSRLTKELSQDWQISLLQILPDLTYSFVAVVKDQFGDAAV